MKFNALLELCKVYALLFDKIPSEIALLLGRFSQLPVLVLDWQPVYGIKKDRLEAAFSRLKTLTFSIAEKVLSLPQCNESKTISASLVESVRNVLEPLLINLLKLQRNKEPRNALALVHLGKLLIQRIVYKFSISLPKFWRVLGLFVRYEVTFLGSVERRENNGRKVSTFHSCHSLQSQKECPYLNWIVICQCLKEGDVSGAKEILEAYNECSGITKDFRKQVMRSDPETVVKSLPATQIQSDVIFQIFLVSETICRCKKLMRSTGILEHCFFR